MRCRIILIFFTGLILFSGCLNSSTGILPSSDAGPLDMVISKNTIWEGEIYLDKHVIIPKGVTLTILPGTVIKFKNYRGYTSPGGRLSMHIEGTLKAIGTAENPIWFTSDANSPRNGDWSMVRLYNASNDTEIRFAIFEFAQQGLNLWNTSPSISDIIVRWNNWEGIYFESYCSSTLERLLIYQNGYNGIAMEQFNEVIIRDSIITESGTHGIHVDASNATIEHCILKNNRVAGLSVDDHGKIIVKSCRLQGNSVSIMCGEGQNIVELDTMTKFVDNTQTNNPNCPNNLISWFNSGIPAPTELSLPLIDYQPYELGYIPGDPVLDTYSYTYPDEDETRRVINKIGEGLGATWSLTWDGEAIWTATLQGSVYRLDPLTGEILTQWQYPGPQAWGMTWDGENLWINDFAEMKVYEMTPQGNVLSSFTIPDKKGGAKGLAWDGEALCIMGWTTSTIYRVDKQGKLINQIDLKVDARGGLTWDGEAFWAPGGNRIYKISTKGTSLGSIYACSEGTWDLAWDGKYLWATQRTNEMWLDKKIYQIEILKLLSQ